MTETPRTGASGERDLAQELETREANLRLLGEQPRALPPGGPKVYSVRRARVTFATVVAVAGLVGWFVWAHWHTVWMALAPLIWIFWRGWRFQRRTRSNGSPPTGL